jgi:hypothetical protein
MTDESPVKCNCGWNPIIVFIAGSDFKLRSVGCPACCITGPARMATADAIAEWNKGHRIDRNGERICDCCAGS